MKILMVSIFAPHFFNWAEQLKESGHEVYWLDVYDSNTFVQQIYFVEQIIGWRYRWDFPGRYYLKKKSPDLISLINTFNERDLVKVFKQKLEEIKPDVVHSFVMSKAVVPIYEIMKVNPDIKWLYSSWGSDLYFYVNKGISGENIKKVLPRIDYMFSDCNRDYEIARRNGFSGKFLGVFPGGGGYDFERTNHLIIPFLKRNIILIKGYQGKHGRCIEVLKSLQNLKFPLDELKIVVFGADNEVLDFIQQTDLRFKENMKIFKKISHFHVMELMGEALLYIGNSISDGMPNTLLEAIVMGAYPIQSNPGGASAELIDHGTSGLLIKNPDDIDEIEMLIQKALLNLPALERSVKFNFNNIRPKLERNCIKNLVVRRYQSIEERL